MVFVKVDKQTGLVISINTAATNPDPSLFLEIETNFVFANKNNDYRWNEADSTFYDVGTKPQVVKSTIQTNSPFSSNYLFINDEKHYLYKRVHGVNQTIASGTSGDIDFVIPYTSSMFSGANIFGVELKDTLDFFILDTATNTYSSLDPAIYGPNVALNQFGFNTEMPNSGQYKNTSSYSSMLKKDMIIRCVYKNNGSTSKYISMNLSIHELKKA